MKGPKSCVRVCFAPTPIPRNYGVDGEEKHFYAVKTHAEPTGGDGSGAGDEKTQHRELTHISGYVQPFHSFTSGAAARRDAEVSLCIYRTNEGLW